MSEKCEICEERVHKYKCPRCLTKTCSLACVKQHKKEEDCNGQRDKTAFVAVKNFTDLHLLSDYRFLEDACRKADNAHRDKIKRFPHRPGFVNKFLAEAKKRGILLKLLPFPLTKRKTNTSMYVFKKRCIMWHTEWNFPQADATFKHRCHEQHTLESGLQKYIHPTDSDPVVRHKLQPYVNSLRENIKVFMKVEGRAACSVRYYELDGENSINDCLKGRLILEYPTFHVVLKSHWDQYTLLDSHDDDCFIVNPDKVIIDLTEGEDTSTSLPVHAPKPVYPEGIEPVNVKSDNNDITDSDDDDEMSDNGETEEMDTNKGTDDVSDNKGADDMGDNQGNENVSNIEGSEDGISNRVAEDACHNREPEDTSNIEGSEDVISNKEAKDVHDNQGTEDTRNSEVSEGDVSKKVAEDKCDKGGIKHASNIEGFEGEISNQVNENVSDNKEFENVNKTKEPEDFSSNKETDNMMDNHNGNIINVSSNEALAQETGTAQEESEVE